MDDLATSFDDKVARGMRSKERELGGEEDEVSMLWA
jgi:hypothetical protein